MNRLKGGLVSFLRKVMKEGRKPDDFFLQGDYPKKQQEWLDNVTTEQFVRPDS